MADFALLVIGAILGAAGAMSWLRSVRRDAVQKYGRARMLLEAACHLQQAEPLGFVNLYQNGIRGGADLVVLGSICRDPADAIEMAQIMPTLDSRHAGIGLILRQMEKTDGTS